MWTVCAVLSGGCADNPDDPDPAARLDNAPMTCTAQTTTYRLVSLDPAAPRAERLDLDGDGHPDDALGLAHDAITSLEPAFAVGGRFPERLATDVPWLIAIDACSDGQARVTIDRGMQIADGADGMMVPKVLARAVGTLRDNGLAASDGELRIPLVALADPLGIAGIGWTEADGLMISATLTDDALVGWFGGAIDVDVARGALASPIASFVTSLPATDTVRIAADGDGDGVVSAAEVADSTTFRDIVQGDVVIREPDGVARGGPASSISFVFSAKRLRR